MSQDAPVTKVWQKSVNRYWRYRGNIKLPRESRTHVRTHARTHGRRHGRTTRKHIASAGAYRRRRLKKTEITLYVFVEYWAIFLFRKFLYTQCGFEPNPLLTPLVRTLEGVVQHHHHYHHHHQQQQQQRVDSWRRSVAPV